MLVLAIIKNGCVDMSPVTDNTNGADVPLKSLAQIRLLSREKVLDYVDGLSDKDYAAHLYQWEENYKSSFFFACDGVIADVLSHRVPSVRVLRELERMSIKDKNYEFNPRTQEELNRRQAQLILNFHHIYELTGRGPEDVLEKGDYHDWVVALINEGSGLSTGIDILPMNADVDEVVYTIEVLMKPEWKYEHTMTIMNKLYHAQIQFAIDHLPDRALSEDEQMLLYMMSAEGGQAKNCTYKLRAKIDVFMMIPEGIKSEYKEKAKLLVDKIISDPELRESYKDAAKNGDYYTPEERLQFFRREAELLEEVFGASVDIVGVEDMKKDTYGKCREGKQIVLQGNPYCSTYFGTRHFEDVAETFRHEYGHVLESLKTGAATVKEKNNITLAGDELDDHRFSLALKMSEGTYISTETARSVFLQATDEEAYGYYRRQLVEKHANVFSEIISSHFDIIPFLIKIHDIKSAYDAEPKAFVAMATQPEV